MNRSSATDRNRDPINERDAAAYIATITRELAALAEGAGMEVLKYLLEMARDEAQAIALEEKKRRPS
ncbi:Uncharacterised protein [Starkeya nomas]|uniref:Uncharacterized protein n=3 Tax=Xanthobacteraceae TaxID=335928 RepID=A0A5S9P3Z2_9HYPH|nr:hypothetical protein [Ancylobacter moscoviensis]TSJ61687.1 hypothetical protein FO470_14600 [Ancylobacter moscoviensis]CAA0098075.1 Uncharacterised protein [Starkeya nomas]